jgi:hypothetical protein
MRTKKALLLTLASGLLAAVSARAQTLRIVEVDGPRMMSHREVEQTYRCASKYFKKVGINFRVKYAKLSPNPCYVSHTLRTRSSELNCLSIFSPNRRKTLNYFITEPFFETHSNGTQTAWIAGLAKLCGNTSTGNGSARSLINGQSSASRIEHSGAIMAHEVMHNMCATHYPSSVQEPSIPNIMNPAATIFAADYGCEIPVLRTTKRQVKRWYAKNR